MDKHTVKLPNSDSVSNLKPDRLLPSTIEVGRHICSAATKLLSLFGNVFYTDHPYGNTETRYSRAPIAIDRMDAEHTLLITFNGKAALVAFYKLRPHAAERFAEFELRQARTELWPHVLEEIERCLILERLAEL